MPRLQTGLALLGALLFFAAGGCGKERTPGTADAAGRATPAGKAVTSHTKTADGGTVAVRPGPERSVPEHGDAEVIELPAAEDDRDAAAAGDPRLRAATTFREVAAWVEAEGDPAAAGQRLLELARERPEHAVADLKPLLSQAHPDVALAAANALAGLGTPEAMKQLLAAIAAIPEDTDLKRDLAAAAAETTNPAGAETLLDALFTSRDETIQDTACRALGHCATPELLDDLAAIYGAAGSGDEKQQLLADVVRHVSSAACVERLADLALGGPAARADDLLASAARDTLGIIGSPAAVEALLALFAASENAAATTQLANAVSRVRNPEAESVLNRVATGQTAGLPAAARLAAIRALGNYASGESLNALRTLAASSDAQVREAARAALAKLAARKPAP